LIARYLLDVTGLAGKVFVERSGMAPDRFGVTAFAGTVGLTPDHAMSKRFI
jgi:hypothetical protein